MKLLFEINSSGITMAKSILGFVDASLNIVNMQTDIEDATHELIKIIGKETYEFIHSKYKESTADDNLKSLVRKAQSVVIHQAFRTYAPKTDVSSTSNGRQMRMDDQHKQAFEWLLDRHDGSLEKTYYKQIDYLIELLDELNPVIVAAAGGNPEKKWKDTDAFKNSFDVLFRTTEEFGEFFMIESRYLLMKLAPGIKKVKKEKISPRIGTAQLDVLMDSLKSGTDLTGNLILQEIKEACAYLALSWAIRRMSATLFPSGVLQSYVSERSSMRATKVPESNEVGVMSLLFEEDGERALVRLEKLLKPVIEHPENEPLYKFNINPDDKFVST